jgi:hypothetical protein
MMIMESWSYDDAEESIVQIVILLTLKRCENGIDDKVSDVFRGLRAIDQLEY